MNKTQQPREFNRLRTRCKQGFTLIELLVVITIVITLAALGFISDKSLMTKAQSATTLGKMRQLGIATVSHTVDKNGFISIGDAGNGGANAFWNVGIGEFKAPPQLNAITNASTRCMYASSYDRQLFGSARAYNRFGKNKVAMVFRDGSSRMVKKVDLRPGNRASRQALTLPGGPNHTLAALSRCPEDGDANRG